MIFRKAPPTEPGLYWYHNVLNTFIRALYAYDGALYEKAPPGHADYCGDIYEFLESRFIADGRGFWSDRIEEPEVEVERD